MNYCVTVLLLPIDGIEPPTFALQERRSTTKPNRHFDGKESNEWGHILDIYWTYIGLESIYDSIISDSIYDSIISDSIYDSM
ncbi:hypothetical protein H8356DRAFT_1362588 [Neocallimastix lanati (nom. inval.)]|nr:hypothetical protein H8356DRAFT_1362588 [Neocallimastix sp. JGI-2020a]